MSAVVEHVSSLAERYVAGAPIVSMATIRLVQSGAEVMNVDDLEKLVGADPELSLRVLSIANSAFYSQQFEIDSLRGALIVLGADSVRKVAAGMLARTVLQSRSSVGEAVLGHCQIVAVVAEMLAAAHRKTDPGQAFVAGLLHRIGELALLQLNLKPVTHDHGELGCEIARRLDLSPALANAIRHHADPNHPDACFLAKTVFIADQIAGDGSHDSDNSAPDVAFTESLEALGLSADDVATIGGCLPARLAELIELLGPTNGEHANV